VGSYYHIDLSEIFLKKMVLSMDQQMNVPDSAQNVTDTQQAHKLQ